MVTIRPTSAAEAASRMAASLSWKSGKVEMAMTDRPAYRERPLLAQNHFRATLFFIEPIVPRSSSYRAADFWIASLVVLQ